MKRFAAALLFTVALAGALAAPARANMRLDAWKGHVAIGFARVFSDSLAPGGSMSVGAGLDYPLTASWRVGPALSLNLLGSTSLTRGSITAAVDYGMFETALLFTHLNARGPIARWSVGPGMASPHADLSVSAGGAGFSDLTVGGVHPELAGDVTFMSRHMPIVAVGGELAARVVPIPSHSTWTLVTARLVIHF